MTACVVISHAAELDFTRDAVSLPASYPSPAYFARADVQAIRALVRENLSRLDEETHFCEQITGRKVLLKPNLVTVFHDLGMRERDYPETTDPRLLDAVVEFLQAYTPHICIAESSGRGMPTRLSFHIAGLDRLARFRKVQLIALEEEPVDRYLLPQARVMREIVIPRIFSEVVRGEAFYISMPKMKTNLYAGVTLGFKNAMGVISYNLRQRNHNFEIDQKLVDMLQLFKADLTIIDGIVGGEGNCPAPVDPVQSRVLISGNQSVETDRVATRMMGFDPASIPILRIADENGFSDPQVKIIGAQTVTPYRAADPSLLGGWMKENFPLVKVLIGHSMRAAPVPSGMEALDPAQCCAMEDVCRGGCLASTRYAFDMLYHEGLSEQRRRNLRLTVIIGAGANSENGPLFYDRDGKAYTVAEIAGLAGKKVAIGTCTRALWDLVDRSIPGCMPYPNSPHTVIHQLSGTRCSVMTLRNRYLLAGLVETLRLCERRKALLRKGQRIDVPLSHENKHFEPRAFTAQEMQQAYIFEPFAPLTKGEIRALCKAEDKAILATFTG